MVEDGSLPASALDTAQGPGTRAHALQQFDGLEPLQHLLVKSASAQAYAVKAGQYIQIVDVDGKQCTDFQCFSQAKLDQGLPQPSPAQSSQQAQQE
jgi:aminomethyltransferase